MNIEDFFEMGVIIFNNIVLLGGDVNCNFCLFYINFYFEGIFFNINLKCNILVFDVFQKFLDNKLKIIMNINYVNLGFDNCLNNFYGMENVMYLWVWFG